MASYHHHHQPCHPTSPPVTTTATACYYCSSYANYTPCHHPPPPDPHLHHPPPLHRQFPSPHPPQTHQYHPSQPQPIHPYNSHQEQTEQHLQPIISSLLRRISALESTLKNHSISASYSVRDAAARTIQTHFRAFLLRRSRTLGQLKKLASIKSNLDSLKLSISRNAYIDYHVLYAKATNLVLTLDSIQGGDPMIRNGKMSINRELNQFLKSIDVGYLKKSELSRKIVRNVRRGGNGSEDRVVYRDLRGGNVETVKLGRHGDGNIKVREQIRRVGELDMDEESEGKDYEELDSLRALLARKKGGSVSRIGGIKLHDVSQAKVKKSVRFADNENAYRFIRSRYEPVLTGECDSDDDDGDLGDADQLLIVDDHCRETQENGILSQEKEGDEEEAQTEDDEGSPPSSNGGSDLIYSSRSRSEVGRTSYDQGEDRSFTFSAPLPVMMEPRADLMDRKKLVK